jgi:hypothetical protein
MTFFYHSAFKYIFYFLRRPSSLGINYDKIWIVLGFGRFFTKNPVTLIRLHGQSYLRVRLLHLEVSERVPNIA